ncbi:hypothetical protein [Kribbella qitaiheensis]|uniref:hypothetical protein n=1 Tax=Kribbella qitaiheensis TaxID=1544730 RepID=UPI00162AD464|nr:hypothetical protein [Kribbella qitaiheensis]
MSWLGKARLTVVSLAVAGLALSSTSYGWSAQTATTWPGGSSVSTADGSNVFGSNLSGLSFQSPTVVWAVKNGPGMIYKLLPDGAKWKPSPSSGKALHYSNGNGDPDAEGVVATPDGLFVSTERDNKNDEDSLLKVLRFDPNSTASSLNATGEWNLTPDLPDVDPNGGLEAISWIPDSFLTAHGFRDEHTGAAYSPRSYSGHGTGLYFLGLEDNATIYAYALSLSGSSYTRVATITTGFAGVMDLEFEPETGHLWAECDDTCSGQTKTLDLNAQGKFAVTATYSRPSGMSNLNNEGFTIAPQSTCTSGHKTVLWSDDGNTSQHASAAALSPAPADSTPTHDVPSRCRGSGTALPCGGLERWSSSWVSSSSWSACWWRAGGWSARWSR